jgi:predicted ferric reductase
MALIPLTMARFSIAALSDSIVNRFVPMNHVLQIHTYLGYTIAFIVSLAAVLFVSLYGTLCAMGEKIYCKGLGSEIMLTGYAITGIIVLIAGTSAYRHQIPYELFYYVHHLVFVFYAVVVLHTFDNEQRNGTHGHERSQAFKWCTATL